MRLLSTLLALIVTATSISTAHAHWRRDHRRHADGYHNRYPVLRLGYHRHGPPYGYKFGFATYRGDPFARDDYYDGRGCYYLHRRDFCLNFRPPLDPFQ